MQDELTQAGLDVTIFGINAVGYESGNEAVCEGRDIGWLQDVAEQEVWMTWAISFRDLVIVDQDNVVVAIYNLSTHNLNEPVNYDEAFGLFEAAAQPSN
ncbi:MAG: hypothetical protein JNL21_16285 [Myxococcales bacterium]|nr:hypothetical protein [Myxococcales bacterium]